MYFKDGEHMRKVIFNKHVDIINKRLPRGLQGCLKSMDTRDSSFSFKRVVAILVTLPGDIRVWKQIQVPFIAEEIDPYDKIARTILELFMRIKG